MKCEHSPGFCCNSTCIEAGRCASSLAVRNGCTSNSLLQTFILAHLIPTLVIRPPQRACSAPGITIKRVRFVSTEEDGTRPKGGVLSEKHLFRNLSESGECR